MYEIFFEMENTPFTRDVPVERLYTSPKIEMRWGGLSMQRTGRCLQW